MHIHSLTFITDSTQATDILKSYGCNLEGLLCDELSGGGGEVTASASQVQLPSSLE